MDFEIVELDEFSGDKAHIYSVCVDGNDNSLFDEFLLENEQYQDWLNEILVKLQNMGNNTGCRRGFFKHEEGKPGDGVAALRVGQLRLYCLYFDNTAVIFGSGGYKSPDIRSYQEDPALYAKASQMIKIAEAINKAIIEKDIVIDDNGEIQTELNSLSYD
jgi:hypothetical protein